MEDVVLKPGTLLGEGRYRIEEKKAAGGFGIVYAAWDTKCGERVAVKELFWREHALRDESGAVRLKDERDAEEYASVRRAFDAEGRTLSRLKDIPGIVHVRDTFEENAAAYIVMDHVEGVTLARQNKERAKEKKPDAVKCFRRFLPLMESLAKIHDAGIIHRDVSPENIIVSAKGNYTLIDFGSAGTYERAEEERFTTIAKDGFAPEEQYREGAKQGPYSDVYGLCATVYTCLTGVAPDSARARRIMDDVKAPSVLGVKMPRELENVLMRGLAVSASKRYADMHALIAAVRRALRARVIRAACRTAIAALAVVCIGLGAWQTAMFFADDTTPADNMIRATWENPVTAESRGKNQVRAGQLKGETQAYLYTFFSMESSTQGERDDLIRQFKARLDTLGVPYAIDADSEKNGCIAVRMGKDRISEFVLSSLAGNSLYVAGEDRLKNVTVSYNRYNGAGNLAVLDIGDGKYALQCTIGDDYSFEGMIENMTSRGEDTLYLCDNQGHALAQAPLSSLEDGVVTFTSLRFEGAKEMNADTRFLADYVNALVNTPPLPFAGTLEAREALDAHGAALKGVYAESGMRLTRTKGDQALVDMVKAIQADTGYICTENTSGTLFINVDLPVDDTLPERAAQVTDQLLSSYPLSEQMYNHVVIIALIDEQDDERLRVVLGRRIALDDSPGEENDMDGILNTSERLKPYEAALSAWWKSLPDTYHGFSVNK